MSVPARAISPEALDEARRLYELTSVPVQQVADMLGIAKSTLNKRARLWGWQRRMARIPGGPMPGLGPGSAPDAGPASVLLSSSAGDRVASERVGLAAPTSRRALIGRLVKRVENEIAAVERLVARAGLSADGAAEAERAARTLAILVRSLRELAALEKNEPGGDEDDAGLRDADAYRRELGETLERVLAGRTAG
ncbi:hypothetical protein [Ancylobacter pratisalsi]|uniref:Uncharacterized protein n=1 Tax=Ancylobacter pratisalsi TaxID=1745854 RepID=A0A6P1YNV3_9HYPH|nr:hypothetical protein [Ancylobacter pratisalsi]QIB35088.1 hypothetical protein G3A50_16265 [Ancylobacter pratisalsi]